MVGLLSELSAQELVVLLFPQLILEGLVSLGHQGLDLVPLGLDVGAGEVGVRVDGGSGHVVLLGELLHLMDQGDDRLELLVGFPKGGLN